MKASDRVGREVFYSIPTEFIICIPSCCEMSETQANTKILHLHQDLQMVK